jgi:hypothetical protein
MAQVIASDAPASATRSLANRFGTRSSDPYRSVLVLRFALLNVLAFALLGAATIQGYVGMVLDADRTYLSVIIFAVFLAGLAICAHKVWQTSGEIDALNGPQGLRASSLAHLIKFDENNTPTVQDGSMRLRLAQRISVVRHLANTLVLLGLIGTVLGFIIALSGVSPEQASDVNAIAPMVSTLIRGMSTALYTTLIGSILNVWLMANFQILSGGTVQLMARLSELGNSDA